MAFEEFKQDLWETHDHVQSYLKNSEEYIYLKSFKVSMTLVTIFIQILLVGALALLALLILALGVSYGFGQLLGNTFYGFLTVGTFILIVAIIAYFMRNRINKPIIRKFSKSYFDKS